MDCWLARKQFLALHDGVSQPALKLGRVIQVTPGLKPGLDHVSRKIKKTRYGSTMTASAATFAS